MLSSVVIVKDEQVQCMRLVLLALMILATIAHTRCSDDTVVSVIPASGAVREYSVTAGGFEGLEFEEPVSGTVIDYALRYAPLCLTLQMWAQ